MNARHVRMLALGADDADPHFALCIALEALHAEAEMLTGETTVLTDAPKILAMAHAKRIEALERLVSDHMTVTWRETGPSGVGVPFGGSEVANG
jgi:hypothetical protein